MTEKDKPAVVLGSMICCTAHRLGLSNLVDDLLDLLARWRRGHADGGA
jgi:hypothetical protein